MEIDFGNESCHLATYTPGEYANCFRCVWFWNSSGLFAVCPRAIGPNPIDRQTHELRQPVYSSATECGYDLD